MKKRKYNVEELYAKELLSVAEVAYLLGSIPQQNVYAKLQNGQLEWVERQFSENRMAKKVYTKSVYEYILKRKGILYRNADKYRLPKGKWIFKK